MEPCVSLDVTVVGRKMLLSAIVNLYRRLDKDDKLSFMDFCKGMYRLSHFESNRVDLTDALPVPSSVASCILYYWRFCIPSLGKLRDMDNLSDYYQSNDDLVRQYCHIHHPDDLLYSSWSDTAWEPGNFAFLDHEAETVVWIIRPTLSFQEILLDLMADSVKFMDGYAHEGMVQAAHHMMDVVFPYIQRTLERYQYTLVICGHSLGAGMATLLSMLIYPRYGVAALAFACPPCVSWNLAESSRRHVMAIAIQDDVITRLSYDSFAYLKKRIYLIAHLGGEDALKDADILVNSTWVHEDHNQNPERLWGPSRTIYIEQCEMGSLRVVELSSKTLHTIIVSKTCVLDHAPYRYIGIFNRWYLETLKK